MSDAANAIQRLLQARTQEDIETILLEEPSLLTQEAQDILARHEAEARKQGDRDSAAMLAELRRFVSDLRIAGSYAMPEACGSQAAFELIHALVVAAPRAGIPRTAMDSVFFSTLDSMRAHATQNKLGPVLSNLAGLDKRLRRAGGRPDEKTAGGAQSIFAAIETWIDTETWLESHTILCEHPELQTEDAATILSLLAKGAQAQGDEESATLYEQHASIIRRTLKGEMKHAYVELLLKERAEREEQGE
jgi:hypothetical protein